MNFKKILILFCLLPAASQINARTTVTVGTSNNLSYTVNVFDPSSNTFYLGHKGSFNQNPATDDNPTADADSVAVANVLNNSTSSIGTFAGSSLVAFPGLGLNRVRNLDIVWNGETKLLVVSKDDHGGYGLGDNNHYGSTAGVVAPTRDAVNELFFINPADGTGSTVLVKDFNATPEDGIIDRVKAFGSTASSLKNDKVAVVVVNRGDKNELLTNNSTEHGMRIVLPDGTTPGVLKLFDNTVVDFRATLSGITYSGTSFDVRSVYSMHWDADLQRLYLGFLSTHGGTGGANRVFIAMARPRITGDHINVTNDDLVLDSIVPTAVMTSAGDPGAGTDVIVAKSVAAGFAVNHLKTMKASTHTDADPRHYLIAQVRLTQANGATLGQEHLAKGIYAVPLVNKGDADDAEQGKVGQKTAPNTVVAASGQMHNHRDLAALVGGAPVPANSDLEISDMQVVGDTVFVCVAGTGADAKAHYSGVYASTAIFDASGRISAWSPWTKVISSADSTISAGNYQNTTIYSIGFDSSAGNFYFVHKSSTGINQVGVTSWGLGDETSYAHSMKNLTNLVNTDFPQTEGGVWMARHFPAIKTAGLGNMDLTVLGSKGKVAIFSSSGLLSVQSYAVSDVAAYTPYAADLANKTNVPLEQRPFAVASLTNADFASTPAGAGAGDYKEWQRHYKSDFSLDGLVYPFCCEVGRVINKGGDATNIYPGRHGYLFVGGAHELADSGKTSGGVWVLSAAGDGWNGRAADEAIDKSRMGSSLENYLGDGNSKQIGDTGLEPIVSQMNFKKLPIISDPVHDLVSTGQFLYAMTAEKLYRIRLHSKTSGVSMLATTFNANPEMFDDGASAVDATTTANLTNVQPGEPGEGTLTTTGKYNNNVVVVQEVKSFVGAGEKFVNMIGIPNTQNIFVATVTDAGDSKIYLIDNANAAAIGNVSDKFTNDGTYNLTIPGKVIRRMNLVMSNDVNTGLTADHISPDGGATPLTAVDGIVGNLYVLTGSLANPNSSLYRLPLKGALHIAQARTNFIDHGAAILAATVWKSAGLIPVVENTNQLYNDINFNGLPLFYAHSNYFNDAEFDTHLGHLTSDLTTNTKSISAIPASTGTKQYTFGNLHLGLGANMLFGSFGAKIQE